MYHSFINLDIIDQIQLECYYHNKLSIYIHYIMSYIYQINNYVEVLNTNCQNEIISSPNQHVNLSINNKLYLYRNIYYV